MNKTLLIVIGIACAVISAAGCNKEPAPSVLDSTEDNGKIMFDKSMYNIVEKEFYNKAYDHYNILLFSPNDAVDFIKRCQELNIRILGIDAFKRFEGDLIQPSMEHSIDYSDSLHQDKKKGYGYWVEAEEFIKSKATLGYIFEIVSEDINNKR